MKKTTIKITMILSSLLNIIADLFIVIDSFKVKDYEYGAMFILFITGLTISLFIFLKNYHEN